MSAEPSTPSDRAYQGKSSSGLAVTCAVAGAASSGLFALSIIVQLALGPNQILGGPKVIGLTTYGAYLAQHGVAMYIAGIMDKLMQSTLTAIADIVGLLAIVTGVIALIRGLIRKERIVLAVTGIVAGSIVFCTLYLGPLAFL